jgi:hypothetical protein
VERIEQGALRVSSSGGPNPLPRATFPELVGRAVAAAIRPRSDPADRGWAESILTPAEFGLWVRQSDYDQHHAIRVARRVERRLASTAYAGDMLWASAALMHDVGKCESNLSLPERAIATLASKVFGVATARRWAGSAAGWRRRLGLYLIHGELGAAMIRAAGGREEMALWSEIHQGYSSGSGSGIGIGIPPVVVAALIESDVA